MRKKIKLAWIKNDASRKQSFKKRKQGLVKKVQELTTLCGVSAFIVIQGPGEEFPTVWPSPAVAHHLIQRFYNVPEMERCKKMVSQESYLRERITKMKDQVEKLFRSNKERLTAYVMHGITEGKPLSQFTMTELGSVLWLLEDKMKEIKRRLEFYRRQPHGYYDQANIGGSSSLTLPPPTSEETTGHREFPWEYWVSRNPLGVQQMNPNGHNFLRGSSSSSSSSGGNSSGGGASSSLQANNGDFFRVWNNINGGNGVNQPYRNDNNFGFGEWASNNNVSANVGNKEVGLGYGYFGGGISTNVTNNVGGMRVSDMGLAQQVNFGGFPNNNEGIINQEMGFGGALQNPNFGQNIGFGGNNENLGFGVQSGQGKGGNHISTNGVNIFQINNHNCINAENDAGIGILGQAQENNVQGDVNIYGGNNGYGGGEIGSLIPDEFLFPSNSSIGKNTGANDAAENPAFDLGNFWPGLF